MPTVKKSVKKAPAAKKSLAKKTSSNVVAKKATGAKRKASATNATAKGNIVSDKTKKSAVLWDIVHVFGYGETQIIGAAGEGRIANSSLATLDNLYAMLKKKQDKGVSVSPENTFSLTLYNGRMIDYRSHGNKGQRWDWNNVDSKVVSDMVKEIMTKAPIEKQELFINFLNEERNFIPKGNNLQQARTERKDARTKKNLQKNKL